MLAKVIIENGQKKIQALTADTGTGAPVGSIIVVCSNILPSGYLGLGVQYDITNYPALYQVLGTDTTPTASALGLPTLSSGQYAIKATSGLTENQQENVLNTINENNSYSTEEHPTGKKWIDGKPIYRIAYSGVVADIGNNVDTELSTILVNKNVDTIIKISGNVNFVEVNLIEPMPSMYMRLYYKSDDKKIYINNSLSSSKTNNKVTYFVEYTKTTD